MITPIHNSPVTSPYALTFGKTPEGAKEAIVRMPINTEQILARVGRELMLFQYNPKNLTKTNNILLVKRTGADEYKILRLSSNEIKVTIKNVQIERNLNPTNDLINDESKWHTLTRTELLNSFRLG